MLRVAICDDERGICDELCNQLKVIERILSIPIEVIDIFTNGLELMEFLNGGRYIM